MQRSITPEEIHVLVSLSHASDREVSADDIAGLLDLESDQIDEILRRLVAMNFILQIGEGYMLDARGEEFLRHPGQRSAHPER